MSVTLTLLLLGVVLLMFSLARKRVDNFAYVTLGAALLCFVGGTDVFPAMTAWQTTVGYGLAVFDVLLVWLLLLWISDDHIRPKRHRFSLRACLLFGAGLLAFYGGAL